MFCSQYNEVIQELADGTLGPVRRAELQTHLDSCDACRALSIDLQKIRDAARSLDPIRPPEQVWLRIAAQLREEKRVVSASVAGGRSMAMLAIAAMLLLAVGGSLYVLRTSGPVNPGTNQAASGNAAPADTVQSITDDLTMAERHYQSAIAKLEEAAKSNDGSIDAETAAILEKNLLVIDQAIAESRSALQSEPQNVPARESLFGALRQKVTLLQATIALMNEMRKGNSAGAAQLLDSGSKS